MRKLWAAVAALGTAAMLAAPADDAQAAEGAIGFYLLGSKTTMAG
jgi:hypothetical protein